MVQFTLGCIIIALTVFFGGGSILDDKSFIENREKTYKRENAKSERSKSVKQRYMGFKSKTIEHSESIKKNITNKLDINESSYEFIFNESKDSKIITKNPYSIEGSTSFANVFNIINEFDRIEGITINNICLKCNLENKKFKTLKDNSKISFQIKGDIYVYKKSK